MTTQKVYLDHAATTPVHPEVAKVVLNYMVKDFGNASSVHSFGRTTRKAMDEARERVADLINANPKEIVFLSGGTEADNLAIKGVAEAYKDKGKHIITSEIEHHAIIHTCQYLEKQGHEVTYLPVDEHGMVSPEDLLEAIRDDTVLVSIMLANNEMGTIQPVEEIGRICREKGVIFHSDGVQAVGSIPADVDALNIDLLSMSSHKLYGPKGVGALYHRKGIKLVSQQTGGSHEYRLRAGTENVPGIAGFGLAAKLAKEEMEERVSRISALRDKLQYGLMQAVDHVKLNGHPEKRLPNNLNLSFEYVEGESMLLNLDMKGIAASSGSACTSGTLDPSHVLLAMGMKHEVAHGSLRMTLGRETAEEDIDYVLEVLPGIVQRLREMSPLYHKETR